MLAASAAARFLALCGAAAAVVPNALPHSGPVRPQFLWREQAATSADAQAAAEGSGQPASPPYAQCLRNTGRPCEMLNQLNASVVDIAQQCVGSTGLGFRTSHEDIVESSEKCNAGGTFPSGVCVCGEGWCADGESKCVPHQNTLLAQVHYITTKEGGPDKYVFMGPNGQVRLGTPPNWKAAQWRIAKTTDNVYHLYTAAYTDDLLDSFDQCITKVDQLTGYSYADCSSVVGHVPRPPASETGWYIERFNLGLPKDTFVSFRSKDTNRYMFFDPRDGAGRSCLTRNDMEECPGVTGAFRFTPSLYNNLEIRFADHPVTGIIRAIHLGIWCVAIIVMVLLCCTNARFDSRTARGDEHCLGNLCRICISGK